MNDVSVAKLERLGFGRTAPSVKPTHDTATPSPAPLTEEWDFRLPEVLLDTYEEDVSVEEGISSPFSVQRLISSLQHGMQPAQLQHYLSFFGMSVVQSRINVTFCGFTAIYYVVATCDK